MSNGIIVRSLVSGANLLNAQATSGIDPAFPVENLFDPQPKVITQGLPTASGSFGYLVDFDLLADRSIDFVAMLFCNASPAATFVLYSATEAQGAGFLPSGIYFFDNFGVTPTINTTRRHAIWAAAARTMRYLRVVVQEPAGAANRVNSFGNIIVGTRLPMAWNYELGSGLKIEDQSIIRTLPGGETAIERGGRTPVWRATWSNITDAEMRGLYAMLLEIGTGAPLIICEDPDATPGQNERIHYGLLTGLDFTERVQADKQRIDLTIREMI